MRDGVHKHVDADPHVDPDEGQLREMEHPVQNSVWITRPLGGCVRWGRTTDGGTGGCHDSLGAPCIANKAQEGSRSALPLTARC